MAIPDPYAPLRRFGNTAMNVLSMRNQQKQNELKNALALRQQKMQEQLLDQKIQKQNAISDLFQPQQVGGPMMAQQGQDYQPVQNVQQMPSREQIASTLGQFGDVEGAGEFMTEQTQPEYTIQNGQLVPNRPGYSAVKIPGYQSDPLKGLTGDAKSLAAVLGRKPTIQELKEYRKSGATNIDLSQTKGRQKVDEAFAGEYVDFVASGGYADAMKQVKQLRGVVNNLKKRDDLTGPIVGSVPDSIKKFTNPESIATREAVEEVVQRNLRLVLGAQFTEKEGERLISRAYNPNLEEERNVKRLNRLLNQIERAAKAKKSAAEYFQKNGTLTGWDGNIPDIGDFYEATAPKSATDYLSKFGDE